MPLPDKFNYLKQGNTVEVRAEALLDRFHRKGGDGSSEVEGYEGSWRRGTVLKHTNKEKTNTRRWVTVRLTDPKAMYKKWKPLGKKQEPPLPMNSNGNGDDDVEDDDEEDWVPPEFLVAPTDIRPWAPFNDASVWPQLDIDELRVGVLRDCFRVAALYVDGRDECARWRCWIRRVFEDGVWLWVKGPEPDMPPWAPENHHVSCCRRSSPWWKSTFGKDRPIFPLEDHLRRERVYDIEAGTWAFLEERAYFDPVWDAAGHINGNSPTVKVARQLSAAEADAQRQRAAAAAVSAAIADGALPPALQQFVHTFDVRACIEGASGGDGASAEEVAEMLREPLFHDTFCSFLLDSLRQESAVARAGVAVFEQIKVTFRRDAIALQEHLAREYARARLL